MIENLLGTSVRVSNFNKTRVSGSFISHYAPTAEVVISERTFGGEGFLALANISTPMNAVRLSSPSTLEEYAKELYVAFRKADEQKLLRIVVVLPEGDGLADAIRDRVIKATGNPST